MLYGCYGGGKAWTSLQVTIESLCICWEMAESPCIAAYALQRTVNFVDIDIDIDTLLKLVTDRFSFDCFRAVWGHVTLFVFCSIVHVMVHFTERVLLFD